MGLTKELRNYGKDHPLVSLALVGTFGYYFYNTMIVPRTLKDEKPNMYSNPAGLGMTTSTSTTTSSSHIPDMMREDAGEPSINIPEESGMYGVKNNPQSFLKYDQVNKLAGLPSSAKRRVSHSNNASSMGYVPKLDTQFSNYEAMKAGDTALHQDILGFSGLSAPSGGDWYE